MKTLLHKLCAGGFLVGAVMSTGLVSAQIDYHEDFTGGHGWGSSTFETTTVAACEGNDALRARINNILVVDLPAITVSPSIGVSNGEEVELTYSYRLLNYDPVLPVIPVDLLDFGAVTLEYATSTQGPWFDLDNITLANYSGSANCTTRIVSFTPPDGSAIFLRFRANLGIALDLDYYVYLDNINAVQSVLSVDDHQVSNDVIAYPNPVTDYLRLDYDGSINDVAVFNMQGQEVATWSPDTDFRRLDLTGLSDGQYIVKVMADTGVQTINVLKD